MRYRLGLDLGSTSIGWAVYDVDSDKIVDLGVRIFDDGRNTKTKVPLSVERTACRGSRRQLARRKIRKQSLVKALVEIGLFPKDEFERKDLKKLNPFKDLLPNKNLTLEQVNEIKKMPLYALRVKALDEKLELYEIGRIFFHLSQRRGFLSNRKDSAITGGKLKEGNKSLIEKMQADKVRTYGEYLYLNRLQNANSLIRLRNVVDEKGNFKEGIEYPYRAQYEKEFEAIWEKQREYYPKHLDDKNKERIKDIIFFQRPLKEQEIGWCQFEENEKRILKAHPLFQKFRILQFINNLKINNKALLTNQREILFGFLMDPIINKKSVSYSDLKKVLKLNKSDKFNYEESGGDQNTKGVLVNKTEVAVKRFIEEFGKEDIESSQNFAVFWNKLSFGEKCKLICFIVRPKDCEELGDIYKKARTMEQQDKVVVEHLCNKYNLSEKIAENLIRVPFEDGYGSLSEKAISKIIVYMENEGLRYDEACELAGYNHSREEYDCLDKLPYYGEIRSLSRSCLGRKNIEIAKNNDEKFGKISNVTVHVALNQIRLVVNELIKKYGKPSDLVIEYARDINASKEKRLEIIKQQEKNRVDNEKMREELEEKTNRKVSKKDIEKYKIWKSMSSSGNSLFRICPYTGKNIGISDLLEDGKVEIDHILPFSSTFDDSVNNKVVCFTEANRLKGNRSPYEAFSSMNSPYSWEKISANAEKLNIERRWRFAPDAMEKFEKKGSLIARALNDTRYMTKILQQYLLPIVDSDGSKTVLAVPGILTAMIRQAWGLNIYKDKNDPEAYRKEHYHHAVDATVLSLMTRRQLQEIEREMKEGNLDEYEKKKIVSKLAKKPKNLNVKILQELISGINVSHKPRLNDINDRSSTVGKLHEDTAYGKLKEKGIRGLFENKKKESLSFIKYVPNFYKKEDKDAYFDAYKSWFMVKGKSKLIDSKSKETIKILKKEEAIAEQKLIDAAKKAFEWFRGGGNFSMSIYEINKNNKIKGVVATNSGEWVGEVVSNYNATVRQRRNENISYLKYKWATAKKIMELRRQDMVLASFSRDEIDELARKEEENRNQKQIDGFGLEFREYLRQEFARNPDQSEIDLLFRVKKIALDYGIFFVPHDIAKEGEGDSCCWSVNPNNVEKMKIHKVRKVKISPAGKMRNA